MTEKLQPWQERYELEWVDVNDLKPKGFQNPNRMTPQERQLLKRSIEEQGIVPPLLVRLETNEVIDGEHRWEVARDELGWKQVPCIRKSMTDVEARIIARRMIRARGSEVQSHADMLMAEIAALGGLDDAQVGLMLSDEEIAQWDSEMEIEALPDPVSDVAPIEVDDEEEAPVAEPRGSRMPAAGAKGGTPGYMAPEQEPEEEYDEAEEAVMAGLASTVDLEEEEPPESTPQPRNGTNPRQQRPAPKHHRVNVLLLGDEAEVVQRVLGRAPAAQLVRMCRYWELEQMEEKLLAAEAAEDEREELAATE